MVLNDIINLFYPRVCLHCGNHLQKQEEFLCLHCHIQLPFTDYTDWADNPLEKIFYGRFALVEGTALFFFRQQGVTQHLIHLLKYKKEEIISSYFGHMLSDKLLASNRFNDIDGIIKVPLHPKKKKQRGYNQLDGFAKVIGENLKIPVIEDVLFKTTNSSTQTRKNRLHRFDQFDDKFQINNPEKINGLHLLLVDDVITTGATLEACATKILQVKNTKVSIATMAVPE